MDMEEEILGIDTNPEYSQFDKVIGLIEEIVVEDGFQHLQKNYFDENCNHFDDCEENKLIYTDIHNQYTKSIEDYIEQRLISKDESFSMGEFLSSLNSDNVKADSEIMELLLSLSDFNLFKESMLSHKMSLKDEMQLACGDFFQVVPLRIDDFSMNNSNNFRKNISKKPEDQKVEAEEAKDSKKNAEPSAKRVEMMLDNLGEDEVEEQVTSQTLSVEVEKIAIKQIASTEKKMKRATGTLNNSYNRQKLEPKKERKPSNSTNTHHNNNNDTCCASEGTSAFIRADEHVKNNSKLKNPFANLSLSKVLRRH